MSETEHEVDEFDVPDDATYGGYPVTEIGYNVDLERVYVLYEGSDVRPGGWDQLIFSAERDGDGTVRVTDYPPGLVPPVEARENNTPGANESEALYDLLEGVGIEVE